MEDNNLNYRSLALKLNISDVQVRNIVLGKSLPKADFFQNIFREFPSVSLHWLLTGEGQKNLIKNEDNVDINSIINDKKDYAGLVRFLKQHHKELMKDELFRLYVENLTYAKALEINSREIKKMMDDKA